MGFWAMICYVNIHVLLSFFLFVFIFSHRKIFLSLDIKTYITNRFTWYQRVVTGLESELIACLPY